MSRKRYNFLKKINPSHLLHRSVVKKITNYIDGSLIDYWYNKENINKIFVSRFTNLGRFLYKKGHIPCDKITYAYCKIFDMDIGLIEYCAKPHLNMITHIMFIEDLFEIDILQKYKVFREKLGKPVAKNTLFIAILYGYYDVARYIYKDLENLYLKFNDIKYDVGKIDSNSLIVDGTSYFTNEFNPLRIGTINLYDILIPWILINDDEMFCNLFEKIWKPYSEEFGDTIDIVYKLIMLFKNDLLINFLHPKANYTNNAFNIICKAIIYHNNVIFDWAFSLCNGNIEHNYIYLEYAIKYKNSYVLNRLSFLNISESYTEIIKKEKLTYYLDILNLFNNKLDIINNTNMSDTNFIKQIYHESTDSLKSKITDKYIVHVCYLIDLVSDGISITNQSSFNLYFNNIFG
jgi:hypothetical protein